MKIVASAGREDVAMVYILEFKNGELAECVEAVQPPLTIDDKWVLMVSTMFGCPVGCMMCDAGGYYHGNVSAEEILEQIDLLVDKRFPNRMVTTKQFKIQFARMGEPTLNREVLKVLRQLPERYNAPGLMPSFSTIAPASVGGFLDQLLEIKNELYSNGRFQFQFSLHTSDEALRDRIIPVKKWSFRQMAEYGERFFQPGDRKITLNFALAQDVPLEPGVLLEYFSPEKFLIKITPLNPTYRAQENHLSSYIDPLRELQGYRIVDALRNTGYQVIISVGEVTENYIGSNCGQYVRRHLETDGSLESGYTYPVEMHS